MPLVLLFISATCSVLQSAPSVQYRRQAWMLPGSEDSRDCTQMRHYHGSESASFSQLSHESTAENAKSGKASS